MRRRLDELQVAFMLLTRLPAGRLAGCAPSPAAASWAFPLVGAAVGTGGWAAWAAAMACGLPASIAAVLSVAAMAGVTGGLHEDGLADVADGFGGGRDAARKLEIMRDSRIGSYGVLVLVFGILLKVLCVDEAGTGFAAFVATAAASRCAMLAAMQLMPPARKDGLGRAAASPGLTRIAAAVVLAALFVAPLGVGAIAVLAALASAALAVGLIARRQIGGQTGDVLGAIQMVSDVAAWLTLAALAQNSI